MVDIEFIVQYLVLAHAHRHGDLVRNLGNIALLQMAGGMRLIDMTLAREVADAYRAFRALQHRLRLNGAERARVEPAEVEAQAAAVRRLWVGRLRGGLMREALRALPSTVWVLGLISLLNDAASELVYPLLPLYLATVLGAGPRALGFIEGAAEATAALLKLVSGVWYDRVRRAKLFMVAGYGFAAVARPLLALAAVVADGAGAARARPARQGPALVAARRAARALGAGRAARGRVRPAPRVRQRRRRHRPAARRRPAGAGHSVARHPAVGRGAGSAVRRARAVGEGAARWRRWPRRSSRTGPGADCRRGSGACCVAISIFTLGQASNAFVILRAHDLGMPIAQTALLWAVVAATSTVLAVPLSAHSDRVGRVPLLTVGWVLHVVLFVVLGWTSDAALMWPAAILLGVYMAATEGSERALIADLVPQQRLGTAYGWYYLAKGLLLLPASAVFGWLWVASGATAAFMLAASFVALATLALVVWVLPAVRHAHRMAADAR